MLLLAPAGYGKTTLAQQWIRTVDRSIWLCCSQAHRDVVTLARDLADRLEEFAGAAPRAIGEYLRAQSTPQRSSRRIGSLLAEQVTAAGVQWIVIDDYHEIIEAPEVEELVDVLQQESPARLIIATRLRPRWATARRIVYGEIHEVTRDMLAMTEQESQTMLGRSTSSAQLARQAQGWPAVLALATGARDLPPSGILPSALHTYLAEELFQGAPEELQDNLVRLALLPTLEPGTDHGLHRGDGPSSFKRLATLASWPAKTHRLFIRSCVGFCSRSSPSGLTHALRSMRPFECCIREQHWGMALGLVSRFACDDLIEPVLCDASNHLFGTGKSRPSRPSRRRCGFVLPFLRRPSISLRRRCRCETDS